MSLYRYWIRIFALVFAMGVVSVIVMSYQFGTNWAVFSDKAGPIIGPLMAYEVLTAFFTGSRFPRCDAVRYESRWQRSTFCGYAHTEGALQKQARDMAWWLGGGTLGAIGAVSIGTLFLSEAYFAKWLTWPRVLWVAPVPLLVVLDIPRQGR